MYFSQRILVLSISCGYILVVVGCIVGYVTRLLGNCPRMEELP